MCGVCVIDVSILIVRMIGDIDVGRMIVSVRRTCKAGEDRLDQVLQVKQRQMPPDCAPEFLIPIQNRLLRGKWIGRTAKVLTIEHSVGFRVGHHEVADD